MAKVKINSLPEGFEVRNGKIVQTMSNGGYTTGDQMRNGSYGLVTNPALMAADGAEMGGLPSMPSIRYSLNPVPRDEANIEAEKGETVLTDLDNDGNFELYDIGGKRHTGGGTPLNLPPQSFIFSDTAKARFNKTQLAELGITSKKKMTPAKATKNFELNPYIGALADPHSDKIKDTSAELMLEKNKLSLSHIAFMQEKRKEFLEGIPLAAHPYLVSQGVDPIEFSMEVEEINRKKAEDQAIAQLPPEQQQKMLMLRQFMEQTEAQQAQQDQEMGMKPPQKQEMQSPQGMAQGMPPQGMPPQDMGQQMGSPPMAPPMGKYGGQPCYGYGCGGEYPLRKAQGGFETWAEEYAQTPEFQALLESGQITMETVNDYLMQKYEEISDSQIDQGLAGFVMEYMNTPEGSALVDKAFENGLETNEDIMSYIMEQVRPSYRESIKNERSATDMTPITPIPPAQMTGDVAIPDQLASVPYEPYEPNVRRENRENRENENERWKLIKEEQKREEIAKVSKIDKREGNRLAKEEAKRIMNEDASDFEYGPPLIDGESDEEIVDPDTLVVDSNAADNELIDLKQPISDEERLKNLTVGEEGDYIDKIIDYELAHGAGDGTGLTIADAFKLPVGATREDARKKIEQEYLPGYENYPAGLKERVVDFHVNSEDPRGSLMVAAGILTPAEKVSKLYTKGSFDSSKVDKLWKKNKAKVEAVYDDPSFIQRFDAEKHRSYKATNGADISYPATWGPRVDMWNEDFNYDGWADGQYYTAQPNGTYKPSSEIVKDPVIETTIAEETSDKPVTTIPPVVKKNEKPDWKKGYDAYKEYWEADERKTFRKGAYNAYKLRAKLEGQTPKSEDDWNKLWLREQKQKRYFNSLPSDQVSGQDWDNTFDKKTKKHYLDQDGVSVKGRKNWRYQQEIANAEKDLEFSSMTDDEIGHTQLMFQGLKDLHDNAEGDPLLMKMFEGSRLFHGGVKDETYKGYKDITKYDKFGGNTWNRQFHDLKQKEEEPVEEPVVEEVEKEKVLELNDPVVGARAEQPNRDFWLQDILGTANAISNKARINKYYPWAPMVEKPNMIPVFDDPTRRIAAINEQKTIGDQARAMYSGPQSLAAFTGKSAGQAMKGIADTVDRVNRYNVDTANKFEGLNANMDFMTQRLNNTTRTKLYDDTMRTEQSYDNAMAQADMAITRQLQNAFTNRANTYNMNTLYDQYNVDPMSGGMIEFTNPRDPYATDPGGQASRENEYLDFEAKMAKLYPNRTTSSFPAFKWIQGEGQPNVGYSPQQQEMMDIMQATPYGVPNMYNQGYTQ
jgi:hypothetical protein